MVLIALVITVVGLVAVNFGWLCYLNARDKRDRQPSNPLRGYKPHPNQELFSVPPEEVPDEPDELELVGSIQPAPPEDLDA